MADLRRSRGGQREPSRAEPAAAWLRARIKDRPWRFRTGIPDEMGGKYKGSTRFGGSRYGRASGRIRLAPIGLVRARLGSGRPVGSTSCRTGSSGAPRETGSFAPRATANRPVRRRLFVKEVFSHIVLRSLSNRSGTLRSLPSADSASSLFSLCLCSADRRQSTSHPLFYKLPHSTSSRPVRFPSLNLF